VLVLLALSLDALTDQVSGSPWTYLVVFVAAGGDVLLPIIPSETILITAGVVAAKGDLSPILLGICGGLGAALGDNIAYLLGDKVGEPIAERLFRGEKARGRLEWSERAIRSHGPVLVLVGRFIPGGRTAATLAAGLLGMPWKTRFLPFDAIAAFLWAFYAVMLGYLGGATFRDSTWKPLLIAFGIACLIGVAIEVYRQVQKRRGKDVLGDPL
jgi:membrane-associated protein